MAKTCPGAGGGLDGGLTAGCGCRSGEPTPAEVLPCAERSLSCVDTLPYELWLRSRSLGSRFIDAIVAQGPSGAQGKDEAREMGNKHSTCGAARRRAAPGAKFASERSFAKLVTDFGEKGEKALIMGTTRRSARDEAHSSRALAGSIRPYSLQRDVCRYSCTDHVSMCAAPRRRAVRCVFSRRGARTRTTRTLPAPWLSSSTARHEPARATATVARQYAYVYICVPRSVECARRASPSHRADSSSSSSSSSSMAAAFARSSARLPIL